MRNSGRKSGKIEASEPEQEPGWGPGYTVGPPSSLLQLKALTFVLKSPDYNNGARGAIGAGGGGGASGRM